MPKRLLTLDEDQSIISALARFAVFVVFDGNVLFMTVLCY